MTVSRTRSRRPVRLENAPGVLQSWKQSPDSTPVTVGVFSPGNHSGSGRDAGELAVVDPTVVDPTVGAGLTGDSLSFKKRKRNRR